MTTTSARPDLTDVPGPRVGGWQLRTERQLLDDQLTALTRWHHTARGRYADAAGEARTREARLDLRRRTDILSREHQALLQRAEQQQREVRPLPAGRQPRVLLLHRNAWLRGKIRDGLGRLDVHAVTELDNGADGVGYAVAEQPDLVLVEDSLPMLTGLEVLGELRRYCPQTVLTAHVGYDEALPAFLEAGVRAAWTRRVPPADLSRAMGGLLGCC